MAATLTTGTIINLDESVSRDNYIESLRLIAEYAKYIAHGKGWCEEWLPYFAGIHEWFFDTYWDTTPIPDSYQRYSTDDMARDTRAVFAAPPTDSFLVDVSWLSDEGRAEILDKQGHRYAAELRRVRGRILLFASGRHPRDGYGLTVREVNQVLEHGHLPIYTEPAETQHRFVVNLNSFIVTTTETQPQFERHLQEWWTQFAEHFTVPGDWNNGQMTVASVTRDRNRRSSSVLVPDGEVAELLPAARRR